MCGCLSFERFVTLGKGALQTLINYYGTWYVVKYFINCLMSASFFCKSLNCSLKCDGNTDMWLDIFDCTLLDPRSDAHSFTLNCRSTGRNDIESSLTEIWETKHVSSWSSLTSNWRESASAFLLTRTVDIIEIRSYKLTNPSLLYST